MCSVSAGVATFDATAGGGGGAPTSGGRCAQTPTLGTAGAVLDGWGWTVPELGAGAADTAGPAVLCKEYGDTGGDQMFTVASGTANGISVSVGSAGAGGLAAGSISVTFIAGVGCALHTARCRVSTVTQLERAVIAWARSQLGAPYVYRGKGALLWTPRGLEPHRFDGYLVYDCSGLVTCAVRAAGGPDWRASHAAQTMHDELRHAPDPWAPGVLRLYGTGPANVSHVAIVVGPGEVLEAAGGDRTTTSPHLAARRSAQVRVGPERRVDFVAARLLPSLPQHAA